jgi:hypothetical protein
MRKRVSASCCFTAESQSCSHAAGSEVLSCNRLRPLRRSGTACEMATRLDERRRTDGRTDRQTDGQTPPSHSHSHYQHVGQQPTIETDKPELQEWQKCIHSVCVVRRAPTFGAGQPAKPAALSPVHLELAGPGASNINVSLMTASRDTCEFILDRRQFSCPTPPMPPVSAAA